MILTNKNGQAVLAYSEEEREKALRVSLTSVAKSLGYTPIRQGSHFSLKEMDSLVIYNDASWTRWSQKGSINSGSQIDFVLEFGNVTSVPEAINFLNSFTGESIKEIDYSNQAASATLEKKNMVLPPKENNPKRSYAYLIQTRGVSPETVSDFFKKGLIYEDSLHHNIVYCGRDPEGIIKYAGMRGTADLYGKKFKCDVPGNDKNYGVNIVNPNSNKLKVFESVIDCMSYIDMTGDKESNKLVLGMVADNPLKQFLSDYSHIKEISFCLDNDEAGQKAIYGDPTAHQENRNKGLFRIYAEKGFIVDAEVPPSGKDWNEALIYSKNGVRKEYNNGPEIVPSGHEVEKAENIEEGSNLRPQYEFVYYSKKDDEWVREDFKAENLELAGYKVWDMQDKNGVSEFVLFTKKPALIVLCSESLTRPGGAAYWGKDHITEDEMKANVKHWLAETKGEDEYLMLKGCVGEKYGQTIEENNNIGRGR